MLLPRHAVLMVRKYGRLRPVVGVRLLRPPRPVTRDLIVIGVILYPK
jgi:hypothetical protein